MADDPLGTRVGEVPLPIIIDEHRAIDGHAKIVSLQFERPQRAVTCEYVVPIPRRGCIHVELTVGVDYFWSVCSGCNRLLGGISCV